MILLYHKVAPESHTQWWVTINNFYRQMEQLQRAEVVTLDEYDPLNPRHVVITFDGVYENVYQYAFPILKKFSYPFELFVTGNYIGRGNEFDRPEPYARFANIDQLTEMNKNGGILQWHGWNHLDLTTLKTQKAIKEEISFKPFQIGGWFAYPHGRHNEDIITIVKEYFTGALSCVEGNDTDKYQYNRFIVTNNTRFIKSTVSLIIPNYNYSNYLHEAIESALRQTVTPDEILFIDDCSEDTSMDIANIYRDKIKIAKNDINLGIVDNFNKAVSLTKGDYICFLGADNRFRADYIEKCKVILDNEPEVGIVYTYSMLFGPRAGVEGLRCRCEEMLNTGLYKMKYPAFTNETRELLRDTNFIHGSAIYRREAFQQVGGYKKSKTPEDWNLFARMVLQYNWGAKLVPEYLLEYRQHSNEQTNVVGNLGMQLSYNKHILSKILKRLLEEKVSDDLLVWIGEQCFNAGIFSDGIEFFKKALIINPENCDALNNIGVIALKNKEYNEARYYFDKVLDINPSHKEANINVQIKEANEV